MMGKRRRGIDPVPPTFAPTGEITFTAADQFDAANQTGRWTRATLHDSETGEVVYDSAEPVIVDGWAAIATPKPRLYIAGVISGDPRPFEEKVAAFREAEVILQMRGYDTVVPLDVPNPHCSNPETCAENTGRRLAGATQPGAHAWECHLRHDMIEMLACDGVALLRNWHLSPGARLEFSTATAVGLPVKPVDEWLVIS